MANHALPATTDTYANVLSYLHARIDDASKWYDSALILSNPPTGVVRWNSTTFTWEKNTGTPAAPTWTAASSLYNININGTVGATTANAGTFTTLTVNTSATLPNTATMGGSTIANLGNTAQSFAGQMSFTNATAPIIAAKLGPGSTQQHTLPAVTSDTITLIAASQTLTNKTYSSGALTGTFSGAATLSGVISFTEATSPIVVAKIGPSTTQQHTLPVVTSDTVALLAATQTFTNKTLTSPAISGGTINNATIGATTASTGAFTSISASSQITSTVATGTAPFVVASTTVVGNLNAALLNGATFAAPGAIGGTTAGSGAFTTLSATSTVSGAGITALMAAPGPIGSTTASSGAFTTLTASSTVTLSPSNANIGISPTGTGTVTIGPATAGAITNMSIGTAGPQSGAFTTLSATSTVSGAGITALMAAPGPIGSTTASTGSFTTLTASGAVTLSPAGVSVAISPTGLGTVTISPATAGSINNMAVGATTANTGAFTTLSASSTVSGVGFSNYLAAPPAIGGTTAAAGSFTTLNATSTVSGAGITALMAAPGPIGSTTASSGAFTTLTASSTVSGVGFNNYLAAPPAIGGTTPASGSFTNLGATGTVAGVGFSNYLAAPPAIGGTTAAAGTFTTLTANTAFVSSGGYLVLGATSTTAPALIDLQSTTRGLKFPVMTTVQKTAIVGVSGLVVYDSNLNKLSCFNGTAWGSVGGGATGGGTDDIFYENGQTITTNYTLTTGKNAMSAGPITLNTGITVTVPDGATWTVV